MERSESRCLTLHRDFVSNNARGACGGLLTPHSCHQLGSALATWSPWTRWLRSRQSECHEQGVFSSLCRSRLCGSAILAALEALGIEPRFRVALVLRSRHFTWAFFPCGIQPNRQCATGRYHSPPHNLCSFIFLSNIQRTYSRNQQCTALRTPRKGEFC